MIRFVLFPRNPWVVMDTRTKRPYLQISYETKLAAEAALADLLGPPGEYYAEGCPWRKRLKVKDTTPKLAPKKRRRRRAGQRPKISR